MVKPKPLANDDGIVLKATKDFPANDMMLWRRVEFALYSDLSIYRRESSQGRKVMGFQPRPVVGQWVRRGTLKQPLQTWIDFYEEAGFEITKGDAFYD